MTIIPIVCITKISFALHMRWSLRLLPVSRRRGSFMRLKHISTPRPRWTITMWTSERKFTASPWLEGGTRTKVSPRMKLFLLLLWWLPLKILSSCKAIKFPGFFFLLMSHRLFVVQRRGLQRLDLVVWSVHVESWCLGLRDILLLLEHCLGLGLRLWG